MIQILGLRDREIKGKIRPVETFFRKGWRLPNLEAVFSPELDKLLESVPNGEKYNLFFTVAECFEESGRKLKEQWCIPFDIDGIVLGEDPIGVSAKVAALACEAIEVDYYKTGVIFSGNGIQLFIRTQTPIVDYEYFDKYRQHYGVMARRIQAKLIESQVSFLDNANIKGIDTTVFSPGRLMRLPHTENRKPNKPIRLARIIQANLEPQDFDLAIKAGIVTLDKDEQLSDEILKSYPPPDTKAVLEGCSFIRYCKENSGKVSEPQWYAQLSITARLDDGRGLSHLYSENHTGYNTYETDCKIDQALAASGPRTCKNIESLWDGCHSCDHYSKVTSPILIKGPDYISSADFGYRERKITKTGIRPGQPSYRDLIIKFKQDFFYKTLEESEQVVVYKGTHWERLTDLWVRNWMMTLVKPEPSHNEMSEFLARLKASSIGIMSEIQQASFGMLNFKNCVVNVLTGETHPHDPKYGFFSVLPHAYDPRATCPAWDKFILEICSHDEEKVESLEEFAGYCISGDEYWLQKALLLVGSGANGKSVFMETLGAVVGKENHSAIPFKDLRNKEMRSRLLSKKFNYSNETAVDTFYESELFKELTGGGVVTARRLYQNAEEYQNLTKFILSSNELPATRDASFGLTRRLHIIELTERFTPETEGYDPHIKTKLAAEVAGICNKLIRQYAMLKHRGYIVEMEKSKELKEEMRAAAYESHSNFHVDEYIKNRIDIDKESEIGKKDLYFDYTSWCIESGFKNTSNAHFFRVAKKLLKEKETRSGGERVFKGIKFRKEGTDGF
jgi:P4 family phage/plasmid primase-like protien